MFRPSPEQILDRLNFFINKDTLWVNNYSLKGQPTAAIQSYEAVLLLPSFPDISAKQIAAISVQDPPRNALEIYHELLGLQIPEKVSKLNIRESHPLREALERRFAQLGLPSSAITFGKNNRQEVIMLYTLAGMKPEDALEELKEHARARITKFN